MMVIPVFKCIDADCGAIAALSSVYSSGDNNNNKNNNNSSGSSSCIDIMSKDTAVTSATLGNPAAKSDIITTMTITIIY